MAYDYLLFSSGLGNNPDLPELSKHTQTWESSKQVFFTCDSLLCSIIRCQQASQQFLWHQSQRFHHEALGMLLRCAIVECL